MKLKTATLYAIIGQIIGFLPSLVFQFVSFSFSSYQIPKWINFFSFAISTGTLILFLFILYKNQK